MNCDPIYTRLRESDWRGKLSDAEEAELRAYLAAHPEAQADWEMETALGEALTRVPDAPMPSNFTARVLLAVERETRERGNAPHWVWSWRSLLPRMAVVVVVAGLGLFAYQQLEAARRAELAQSVVAVADVKSLPSPRFLEDFDVIRRLNPAPPADEDLLALLQ